LWIERRSEPVFCIGRETRNSCPRFATDLLKFGRRDLGARAFTEHKIQAHAEASCESKDHCQHDHVARAAYY